jgi:hypothetical protein
MMILSSLIVADLTFCAITILVKDTRMRIATTPILLASIFVFILSP